MKAIITKYHGPTNSRGSRISASDEDGNRVTVSYDHASHDPHRLAAIALCKKMGWTGTLIEGGLGNKGNVYVWAQGEPVYV
jgi:hypothetical protein